MRTMARHGAAALLVFGLAWPAHAHAWATLAATLTPSGGGTNCDMVLTVGAVDRWRRALESEPAFFMGLSSSAPVACAFEESDGKLRADYWFSNGNTLRATRDLRLEHTTLVARSTGSPLTGSAVLATVERALFGRQGCGIDWQAPLLPPAIGTVGYVGDVCHCRASVDRNAQGAITFFSMHGSC